MRSLAHSRGVATGLLGVSAVVCFGLWGFATPSAPPPEAPRAIETTSADAGQDLAQLTQAVAARPLFQPSRRPAATAAVAPAPVAAETTISLIGIVTDGDRNIALMRLSGSSQLHRVEAGMALDRWTIHAIDANGAALSKEGEDPYILDINK